MRGKRGLAGQRFGNYPDPLPVPLTNSKIVAARVALTKQGQGKSMPMNGEAVLENVRRYRAIASLYRQTAAFRPTQRCSLLGEAIEWERRAVAELEAYFSFRDRAAYDPRPQFVQRADAGWGTLAAA